MVGLRLVAIVDLVPVCLLSSVLDGALALILCTQRGISLARSTAVGPRFRRSNRCHGRAGTPVVTPPRPLAGYSTRKAPYRIL